MIVTKSVRERLLPYRILAYLLYAELPWIEVLGRNKVRLYTADAARAFRMKSSVLWDALYWLEKQKLVVSLAKERKRGTIIVELREVLRDFEE